MGLVTVPPWVQANMEREAFVDESIALAQKYTHLLREHYDDRYQIVWVKESEQARQAKLEPGRWHVKRSNDGAPDSYMPITTPDGGYRDPDSGVLDELGRRDLWRTPYALEDMLARQQAKQAVKDADAARADEDRRGEVAEIVKSAGRTQIRVKGIPNGNA